MARSLTTVLCFLLALSHAAHGFRLHADIAIVGGGTAGSVLAARLCTALPEKNIIVLEKGPPKKSKDELIRKSIRLQFDATQLSFVEQIESEPVPAFNGRRMSVPVATGYGGASNVNGGFLGTAPNLQYATVFKHMNLSEIRAAKNLMRNTTGAGVLLPDGHPFAKVLQKAVADANINSAPWINPDTQPEDERQLTSTIFTPTGMRQSVDESYLGPVKKRCKNLRLLNNILVDRVEFRRGPKRLYRATGVHFIAGGQKGFLRVKNEVIVSAGSIYSATILQRSGLGEKHLLKRLGIRQRVNLKVGKIGNKIMTLAFGKFKRPAGFNLNDAAFILSKRSKQMFWAGKGGPLATGPFGGGGNLDVPRGKCYFSISAAQRVVNQPPIDPKEPGNLNSVCMCPSDSAGMIEARSTNPRVPPKLDLNFVNSAFDVRNVRQCAGVLDKIFRSFPPKLEAVKTFPQGGLENYEWKNATSSSYHLSGACAVGRVLDNMYQVKGTQALRVVDSSSVPDGYPEGLFSATMIMAEHASTLIVRRHQRKC